MAELYSLYRELLDSWKLWEQRAEFDIMKNKNNQSLIPQPEVTVSCNFCGKSISTTGMSNLVRGQPMFSRFTTTSAKIKVIKFYFDLIKSIRIFK